jgi:hypothetical protein
MTTAVIVLQDGQYGFEVGTDWGRGGRLDWMPDRWSPVAPGTSRSGGGNALAPGARQIAERIGVLENRIPRGHSNR